MGVDDVSRVRDSRTRDEVVVTALQHEAGEVAHDRLRLEMKVMKHFIRPPAAIRRMISVSTRATRRAMAPPAHRERAVMSSGRRPMEGPRAETEMRRTVVMSEGVTE